MKSVALYNSRHYQCLIRFEICSTCRDAVFVPQQQATFLGFRIKFTNYENNTDS